MAYICEKNIRCAKCRHFRYDDERMDMSCWAAQDEKHEREEEKLALIHKLLLEKETERKRENVKKIALH